MAHMIDTTSRAFASYASTQREWHGLGQTMQQGQTLEQWATDAGMDYEVMRAFVRYAVSRDPAIPLQTMKDQVVLFRSDTQAPLGLVSDGYKIVQPKEVLQFFGEWLDAAGLTMESAGVLFGGKRYFATAKIAAATDIVAGSGDRVGAYALLSTSADGSLATEFRWTSVRVVCNNTLRAASGSAAHLKVTHRSAFKADTDKAREVAERAHEEFGRFMAHARALASRELALTDARELTAQLLAKPLQGRAQPVALSGPIAQPSGESLVAQLLAQPANLTGMRDALDAARETAGYQRILDLFSGAGKGSSLPTARGTRWGWLNAVTEYVDHDVRARSDENRQASAQWGPGAALKTRALELVA